MNPGFGKRLLAYIIDSVIISFPLAIIGYVLFGDAPNEKVIDLVALLYMLVLPTLWKGRTIGKKAMGICIRTTEGYPPGFYRYALRAVIGNLLYAMTLGIGLVVSVFMVALREDRRAIHDFIAGTIVVYDDET